MSLNGCTFVKLLKAEGMGKFYYFCFFFFKEAFLRMATLPLRFSFQIRLSGVQCSWRLLLQLEPLFDIQAFHKILPEWLALACSLALCP